MQISHIIAHYTSDDFLFPTLQLLLALVTFIAWLQSAWGQLRSKLGNLGIKPIRGDKSMNVLYGTYAAVNGLLIAICLSVEIAARYRVFWVAVDTIMIAYLSLRNPWFRNLLIGWSSRLTTLEKR